MRSKRQCKTSHLIGLVLRTFTVGAKTMISKSFNLLIINLVLLCRGTAMTAKPLRPDFFLKVTKSFSRKLHRVRPLRGNANCRSARGLPPARASYYFELEARQLFGEAKMR